MVDPTGQSGLGACDGKANRRGPSTARYTSRSVIASDARVSRQPPPAPPFEATSRAVRSAARTRRITTGFVFTLPAMRSEVSGRSADARSVGAWTATANLLESLIRNQSSDEIAQVKRGRAC